MNKILAEAEEYVLDLRGYLESKQVGLKLFIVPSFTVIKRV